MNYKLSDQKQIFRPDSFCLSDFPDFTFPGTGHIRISVIKPSIFFTTTDRTLTVPNDFNLIEKNYTFFHSMLYTTYILGIYAGKLFLTFSNKHINKLEQLSYFSCTKNIQNKVEKIKKCLYI